MALLGRFGETPDIVLRRVFNIGPNIRAEGAFVQENRTSTEIGTAKMLFSTNNGVRTSTLEKPPGWKTRRTTNPMRQMVLNGKLILQFASGTRKEWTLPLCSDKVAIRRIRDEAVEFARRNGGTKGQEHAVIRALTSRGFHISR